MTTEGSRRGALSDQDIRREIRARDLITRLPEDPERERISVQPSSYDLHVGHVITAQSDPVSEEGRIIRLQPGEMAILGTRENLKLPPDITGLIVPRDGSAKAGLLILNAGHVDPGYDGFVTAQVINLGREEFPISVGCSYFSIVFDYLNTEAQNARGQPLPAQERLAKLSEQATHLARSIIEVQKEEIARDLRAEFVSRSQLNAELLQRVWWLVAGLAVVATIVSAIVAALERWA